MPLLHHVEELFNVLSQKTQLNFMSIEISIFVRIMHLDLLATICTCITCRYVPLFSSPSRHRQRSCSVPEWSNGTTSFLAQGARVPNVSLCTIRKFRQRFSCSPGHFFFWRTYSFLRRIGHSSMLALSPMKSRRTFPNRKDLQTSYITESI